MTPNVQLHFRHPQHLVFELIHTHHGWYLNAHQVVVLFCFFVWCFHIHPAMIVPAAHQRLGLAGEFIDRNATIQELFPHVEQHNCIDGIMQNLASDSLISPLAQRQKAEIFFA
ncbi:MAG: hypothetical protein PHG76_02680 [Eubacteriales bacterium]|nr:hypothetical protein [Eubacteriales bacterium]MDD4462139.1 hypothetical protein [Eubacteriales bacterium]NLO37847.1 hypothetical protein [Clostridiaceae bacterium]